MCCSMTRRGLHDELLVPVDAGTFRPSRGGGNLREGKGKGMGLRPWGFRGVGSRGLK